MEIVFLTRISGFVLRDAAGPLAHRLARMRVWLAQRIRA
jgi:hypothetical protein